MSLIQTVHLTTDKKKFYPILNMVQNDDNRTLICEVDDWEVPDDADVRLYCKSPNNILTYVDGEVNSHAAVFQMRADTLIDFGVYAFQLMIRDSLGKTLKTFLFAVDVEPAAYSVPISDEDRSNIQQILDDMADMLSQAEDQVEKIENMSATATSIPSSSSAYVNKIINPDGTVTLAFGIPRGVDGTIAFRIVQVLPPYGEEGVVYLVPSSQTAQGDLYDEYTFIDGNWERLGGLKIDLDPYATDEEVAAMFNSSGFAVDTDLGLGSSFHLLGRDPYDYGVWGISYSDENGIRLTEQRRIKLAAEHIDINAENQYVGISGDINISGASAINIDESSGPMTVNWNGETIALLKKGTADNSVQNGNSTAGVSGFYYDTYSEDGNGNATLRLLNSLGSAATVGTLAVGDEISFKADYSANFCATITAIEPNNVTGMIAIAYNTYPMPSNFVPLDHMYSSGYQNRGYIWVPTKTTAGGRYGVPIGSYTVAFGAGNKVNEYGGMACGLDNVVDGRYAFASGRDNVVGYSSHVEGMSNTAKGLYSHAEGYGNNSTANYAHAEGKQTTASGADSHAEGYLSTASGAHAHSEGQNARASGPRSHAEGINTIASGYDSHAEGFQTEATGQGSHTEGQGTISTANFQHVQGKYNVSLGPTFSDVVGWGSATNTRKNISVLDTSGNLHVAGDIYVSGNTGDSTNKCIGGNKLATQAWVNDLLSQFARAEEQVG